MMQAFNQEVDDHKDRLCSFFSHLEEYKKNEIYNHIVAQIVTINSIEAKLKDLIEDTNIAIVQEPIFTVKLLADYSSFVTPLLMDNKFEYEFYYDIPLVVMKAYYNENKDLFKEFETTESIELLVNLLEIKPIKVTNPIEVINEEFMIFKIAKRHCW